MKKLLLLLLLFPLFVRAQTSITITGAKAYTHAFLPALVNGLPIVQNGIATNGDVWMVGFILHYDENGAALPIECVRINATTQTTTTKIIAGTISSTSMMWANTFDGDGNIYFGFSASYKIFKFNFKDSIYYEDLGGGFESVGASLAYSITLGRDGNMYFGSSGGSFWTEYNTVTHVLTEHPEVDPLQNYVFAVLGDSDWVYLHTGQNTWVKFIAVRKSDNYQKTLDSLPSSTRFSTSVYTDGIYMANGVHMYRVHDTTLTIATPSGTNVFKYETTNGITTAPQEGYKLVVGYYNPATDSINYSIDGEDGDVHISSTQLLSTSRLIFGDRADTSGFYHVGDYYGNYYWHDYNTDSSYSLGYTNMNIYSEVQFSDSIFVFAGYPSGVVMVYNKNQPWTLNTLVEGVYMQGNNVLSNPHIIANIKATGAGIHHVIHMLIDRNHHLVCAGDVIRIGPTTTSIGVTNITGDTTYGYDYTKVDGLETSSMAEYGNHIVWSTNNNNGGDAKLYYYNPVTNLMDDSSDFGFSDYGVIQINRDVLTGVAPWGTYTMHLPSKRLLSINHLTIASASKLEHDYIGVNTLATTLPTNKYTKKYGFSSAYPFNNYIYRLNGINILRMSGFYPDKTVSPHTSNKFFFYPNPVSTVLHVNGEGTFNLKDINGSTVKSRAGSGTIVVVDLAAGTYFLNGELIIKL